MAGTDLLKQHLVKQRERMASALEKGDTDTVASAARSIEQITRDLVEDVDPEDVKFTVAGGGSSEVVRVLKHEDDPADMFDRFSPSELTRLYVEDRETWDEIVKAKEERGVRKLLET